MQRKLIETHQFVFFLSPFSRLTAAPLLLSDRHMAGVVTPEEKKWLLAALAFFSWLLGRWELLPSTGRSLSNLGCLKGPSLLITVLGLKSVLGVDSQHIR